jgi:hypothetical protein
VRLVRTPQGRDFPGIKIVVVLAVASLAPLSLAGTAEAAQGTRREAIVKPVLRYAKTSVFACRERSGGFATVSVTAVNRGRTTVLVKSWPEYVGHVEVDSRQLRPGERSEVGNYGTTGSMNEQKFHLVGRARTGTRTKVIAGSDLPSC